MKRDLFNKVCLLLQNNNKFNIITKQLPANGYGFTVYHGFIVVPVTFFMATLDKGEHLLAHKAKNSLKNFIWKVQKRDFEVTAQVLQYLDNLNHLPPKTSCNCDICSKFKLLHLQIPSEVVL